MKDIPCDIENIGKKGLHTDKEEFRDHVRELKRIHFAEGLGHYFSLSKQMTERALELEVYQKAQAVGLFASKKESLEIHTDDLINHYLFHDKDLYLPRCLPENRDLEFVQI